ncbi:Hsp20/alpha crystallin family protein [Halorhodospira halochloris]|uniref:Hsp20/alpha crystallin family protein n=1 Tax=Halorhodospira halochloris TaxID=1052 RepID=UPI001EE98489|nr:Hsp20/alpha crystallin family protein [Halorhodospira halochloris]MCG5548202.1 Hsp20/alpha crystallin family protein [Halorhodospira halochloris]
MMVRRNLSPVTRADLHNRAANRDMTARDPFTALQSEMMRFFDDLRRGAGDPSAEIGPRVMAPSVEVQEDDNNLYVVAELPGMTENDVELTFSDGILRIAGEKRAEHEDKDEGRQVHITERSYGRFERQIPLNRAIDEDNVNASFKDGVLTVTMPKAEEEQQARRIEVQRAA